MNATRTGTCFVALILTAGSAFAATKSQDEPAFVKAIHFKDGVIDKVQSLSFEGGTIRYSGTISFDTPPPCGDFPDGMFIRGLLCRPKRGLADRCLIFMDVQKFESRPHDCRVAIDGPSTGFPPQIECPTEIEWLPPKH